MSSCSAQTVDGSEFPEPPIQLGNATAVSAHPQPQDLPLTYPPPSPENIQSNFNIDPSCEQGSKAIFLSSPSTRSLAPPKSSESVDTVHHGIAPEASRSGLALSSPFPSPRPTSMSMCPPSEGLAMTAMGCGPPQSESKLAARETRLHEATLRITPSMFSLNMGTGIVSILLYNFPYSAGWLQIIGIVIFALNVVFFAIIAVFTITRYARWRGIFSLVGRHQQTGMFWGCLPMGFATIVNMVAFVLAPVNYQWACLAVGLWWIDVCMSIFVNFGMIFMMFSRHTHTWSSVSATWLLPIVASVVAAASGGVVASALTPYDPALARSTIIVAYIVWGTGVPLAGFIITLWIARTAIHGLPTPNTLCSVFLPLGPCGQGSFGILLLGKAVRTLAYDFDTPFAVDGANSALRTADVAWGFGLLVGMIVWGLGLCWYLLAHAIVLDHMVSKDPWFLSHSKFSVGMWALTFPLGVFATATYQLAIDLDSEAFRVIGAFQGAQVTLYWLYVLGLTGWKGYNRTLFVAPELEGFEEGTASRWRRRRMSAHSFDRQTADA